MQTFVDELVEAAWNYQASDLFLAEGNTAKVKVSGRIHECGERIVTHEEMEDFWKRCAADPSKDQDRDSGYIGPHNTRFRVNLHRRMGTLGAVLRMIKNSIPNMESLGLPEQVVTSWLGRSSGLLLVTGATGSGKSTTLASCLEYINANQAMHIVTIEDPIEYHFSDKRSFFTQRQVGTDTPSFAAGLRAAMRQAPNIILLGEIRDAETALTALQAAETGHLVFATLHSSTVADTLDRFVHLVPSTEREALLQLLSYQLIGILTQQLLPNATGDGVAMVCEHLDVQAAVRDWIREMKLSDIEEFMRRLDNPANQTFLNGLVAAFKAGKISYDTALAHCGNPYELNRLLRGIS
ncbi:MAG: PilT/PilU family type 4a pilus ATPase [Verrucomicrobiales bacterium]|nr:PilT/PilU family type 4a pilus ATPase [Verrucomicrobiales bacterium]